MDLNRNAFKHAIAAGTRQIGFWCSLGSNIGAEILADSGFDWLLFDMEHTPVDLADLVVQMQAAATGTATPIVRPPWNDTVMIKRVLDAGTQTILIPFVQTPEEAAEAAAASYYPPKGIRGTAGSARSSRYGRVKNYLKTADSEICVLVQIETGESLEKIDEIAAVEGIDGVFIGPSDLAASLGHIGDRSNPDVQAAIRHAADRLKAVGKPTGILAADPDDAERYIDWGYTFVAVGIDTGLLAKGADALVARFKG